MSRKKDKAERAIPITLAMEPDTVAALDALSSDVTSRSYVAGELIKRGIRSLSDQT